MNRFHSRTGNDRPAFTLVELLVVILIMLILAGMLVAVTPGASARSQAFRAAATLQGALLYAKNRARMNMLPTGVLINSATANQVFVGQQQSMVVNQDTLQFVQSGGDYTQGVVTNITPGNNGPTVMIAGGNVTPPTVNPGDYFELAGSGLPHSIQQVGNNQLLLFPPAPNALPSFNLQPPNGLPYRIMRSPRQLFGEAPVELPQNYSVDLPNCIAVVNGQQILFAPNPLTPPPVLFAPSGVLTGGTAGASLICFVVRDTTAPNPYGLPWGAVGFPTIIAVYGNSGFITAHPVNINLALGGGDPYYFAKNARSSGM